MMHITQGLILYLLLIISLSLHEWAHGFVAYKLGDKTPLLFGRLTLNPLAHIDLVGTVIVPLSMLLLLPGFVLFGWAKPVPINPNYFKNSDLGEIFTGLAGPIMNLSIATISAILGAICVKFFDMQIGPLFGLMMLVNIMLCVFNMIPVPPLDGSHILRVLFRMSSLAFYNFSRYGFFILLVLINIPSFRNAILTVVLYLFNTLNGTICDIFVIPLNSLFPL